MADANTTRYSYVKPEVGASADSWGGKLNQNFDDLDAITGAITTTGSSNAYVLTTGLSLAAYVSGQAFKIKTNFANTGAATINVDTLGAKSIVKNGSTALASGDLASGQVYEIAYDGTNFQLVGKFGQTEDADLYSFAALGYTSGSYLPKKTAADTWSLVDEATYAHLAGPETFTGSKTFSAAVTVSTNSTSLPSPTTGTLLHTGGADSATPRWFIDGFAATPTWEARRANGTNASKSAMVSGDNLLNIQVTGYGATAYSAAARGAIRMTATENWTDSAHGTRGTLHSTTNGSTTLTERYRWGDLTSVNELGFRDGGAGSVPDATYTFALTDRGMPTDHSSGSAHTYTVPPQSSVAMPANAVLYGTNFGAGVLTIARGSGVTFRDAAGTNADLSIAQYQSYSLRRHPTSSDTWTVRTA